MYRFVLLKNSPPPPKLVKILRHASCGTTLPPYLQFGSYTTGILEEGRPWSEAPVPLLLMGKTSTMLQLDQLHLALIYPLAVPDLESNGAHHSE